MKSLFSTANDVTYTLMRLVLGIVFFLHGAQLTLGWYGGHTLPQTAHGFAMMGIPLPLAYIAILAQFLGGLGLIFGLLVRIAALGIAIDMLVAIMTVHIHVGFFMNWFGMQKGEGYEYHLLVIALCVLILIKGAGAFSMDRLISAKDRVE